MHLRLLFNYLYVLSISLSDYEQFIRGVYVTGVNMVLLRMDGMKLPL